MIETLTFPEPYKLDRAPAGRPGVNRERILDCAAALVAGGDLSALTCAALARMLRIRPPSLYRHFDSLEKVRDGLAIRALTELTDLSRAAISGRAGRCAVEALADAQRVYAHAHPGMYEVAVRGPTGFSVESAKAMQAYQAVELAALRAYGLPNDEAPRLARCLRASIWGFISIELRDPWAKPLEVDEGFDRLIDLLDAGARAAEVFQPVGLKLAVRTP